MGSLQMKELQGRRGPRPYAYLCSVLGDSYKGMNLWKALAKSQVTLTEDIRLHQLEDLALIFKLESIVGFHEALKLKRLVLQINVLNHIAALKEYEPKVAYQADQRRQRMKAQN